MATRIDDGKPGGDFLPKIAWGTHLCHFYETREDLLDILIPYFREGLEKNELCLWVTAEPLCKQDALEAARAGIPGFDGYLEEGRMEIYAHDEWYVIDGVFDMQRVLSGWVEKHDKALARGMAGVRITGNTAWLEKSDWESFTAYEETINNVIGRYRMAAI